MKSDPLIHESTTQVLRRSPIRLGDN